MKTHQSKYALIFFGALVLVVFFIWLVYNPTKDFTVSLPGLDSIPSSDLSVIEEVEIGEYFVRYAEEDSDLKGIWNRFRGGNFDNIVKDVTPLIGSFGKAGPKKVWEVDLGEGHAGPVIYRGKVYLLDYLEKEKQDALRCFSLSSGKELWRRSYDIHVKRNHGMSRTIPAINNRYLLTIGPMGHVMCLDPVTGDYRWGLDLVKRYGAVIPFWYTGQCPVIEEDIAILATGGKAILIGVDCESGAVVWETPNPDSLQMSHSSIMPMEIGDRKCYVYAAIGGIVGISASGPDRGQLLWKSTAFVPSVVAPSPLMLPGGKLFITAGYGAGSALLRVDKRSMEVETLDLYKPKEGLASEQQTPVVIGDKVYGILPKDAGPLRNQLACYQVDDLKNPVWTSGKAERFGLGPYIYADGKFFIVSDDGTLTIAQVSASGFKVLDAFRVIEGHDAWGPIAIADGRLLMRDANKMVCLDMRK